MGKKISYCGIDCSQCEEHCATMKRDTAAFEDLVAYWRQEYPNATRDEIACYGCREEGDRVFFLCHRCIIRTCARGRGVNTCAECKDYPCEALKAHLALFAEARRALEQERERIQSE